MNKKGTTNLWFRLNKSPMDVMRESKKEAFVCLTNPAEKYGFVLPLVEIDKKIKSVGWSREALEVNIDSADSRWRELEWNLEKYLYQAEEPRITSSTSGQQKASLVPRSSYCCP